LINEPSQISYKKVDQVHGTSTSQYEFCVSNHIMVQGIITSMHSIQSGKQCCAITIQSFVAYGCTRYRFAAMDAHDIAIIIKWIASFRSLIPSSMEVLVRALMTLLTALIRHQCFYQY